MYPLSELFEYISSLFMSASKFTAELFGRAPQPTTSVTPQQMQNVGLDDLKNFRSSAVTENIRAPRLGICSANREALNLDHSDRTLKLPLKILLDLKPSGPVPKMIDSNTAFYAYEELNRLIESGDSFHYSSGRGQLTGGDISSLPGIATTDVVQYQGGGGGGGSFAQSSDTASNAARSFSKTMSDLAKATQLSAEQAVLASQDPYQEAVRGMAEAASTHVQNASTLVTTGLDLHAIANHSYLENLDIAGKYGPLVTEAQAQAYNDYMNNLIFNGGVEGAGMSDTFKEIMKSNFDAWNALDTDDKLSDAYLDIVDAAENFYTSPENATKGPQALLTDAAFLAALATYIGYINAMSVGTPNHNANLRVGIDPLAERALIAVVVADAAAAFTGCNIPLRDRPSAFTTLDTANNNNFISNQIRGNGPINMLTPLIAQQEIMAASPATEVAYAIYSSDNPAPVEVDNDALFASEFGNRAESSTPSSSTRRSRSSKSSSARKLKSSKYR